jgi:hypothetical protein
MQIQRTNLQRNENLRQQLKDEMSIFIPTNWFCSMKGGNLVKGLKMMKSFKLYYITLHYYSAHSPLGFFSDRLRQVRITITYVTYLA